MSEGGAEVRLAGPQAVMGTVRLDFKGIREVAGDDRDRDGTEEGERAREGGGVRSRAGRQGRRC